MRKHLILLMLFPLLLTACADGGTSVDELSEISVYRLIRQEYRTGDELLRAEKIPYTDISTTVEGAAIALGSIPGDPNLESALPAGISILSAEQRGRNVYVTMSDGYGGLYGTDRTIVDSSITLTMCSIPNVDFVNIQTHDKSQSAQFTSEDFMLRNTQVSAEKGEIRLYFPRKGDGHLSAEYRQVTVGEDIYAERVVLDELLKGPASTLLSPALPEDTVYLSVYTLEGVCTVSFSEDFLDSLYGDDEQIALAVYSVVNSLTCLKDVNSVRVVIQNSEDEKIGNINISEPLMRRASLIGAAITD